MASALPRTHVFSRRGGRVALTLCWSITLTFGRSGLTVAGLVSELCSGPAGSRFQNISGEPEVGCPPFSLSRAALPLLPILGSSLSSTATLWRPSVPGCSGSVRVLLGGLGCQETVLGSWVMGEIASPMGKKEPSLSTALLPRHCRGLAFLSPADFQGWGSLALHRGQAPS